MKAKALTDLFSVVDEQGTHTWTIGETYHISPRADAMDITSDLGTLSVTYTDYWYNMCEELFGIDRALIDLYAEQQRRK